MNHNRLVCGLLILGWMIAAGSSWADTDTVDAEIAAVAKAGPAELKKLELRAVETEQNQ